MKTVKWGLLTLLLVTITSCYPDYDREIEDLDVVITMKNSSHFRSDSGQTEFKYYMLADTVMHVADSLKEDLDPDFPRDYDEDILAEVEKNLNALGYERLTDTLGMNPDVLISVSALAVRNTVVYSYYPGYWWGGGYWGGYWGGYYPGYPWYPYYPSYSVYTYNKGSVYIDMVSYDPTQPVDEVIVGEWLGVLNGLLYEGESTPQDRITYNMDKLFEKSPYLQYIGQ